MGCPTSRAFREVGRRIADTGVSPVKLAERRDVSLLGRRYAATGRAVFLQRHRTSAKPDAISTVVEGSGTVAGGL
jgi:hypothetical protein